MMHKTNLIPDGPNMSRKKSYFGTDGIRGRAGEGKLAPEVLDRLALAIGEYVMSLGNDNPRVVVGWDTRASGDLIRACLFSGLTKTGCDVLTCGVIPTPGVAVVSKALNAELGIMITASHNPYHDNGIKFFNSRGEKLEDEGQLAIEAYMDRDHHSLMNSGGNVSALDDAADIYTRALLGSLPDAFTLNGLNIVLDCAHGAAFDVGPQLLSELNPENLAVIGASPDGKNINKDCGSTHPSALMDMVVQSGADLGIAFDGDADRIIMCDEKGQLIDGDQILAFLTRGWKEQGLLKGGGLVATVMSNLGLERMLLREGLSLIRTKVGDRHVAARMRGDGYNIGGEQSGHILMTDFGPSGDALLAALQVLVEFKRLGQKASQALSVFEPVPQQLINVRYNGPSPVGSDGMNKAVSDAAKALGTSGRILVRASGTEPVIRVMAEGDDAEEVAKISQSLADKIGQLASGDN